MTDKDRIKELEQQIKDYESDVSAQFYITLVGAIKHIETEVKNKTLDFDKDTFASSILVLADKSGKIFEGLRQGRESFKQQTSEDTDKNKKVKKASDRVGI